MTFADWTVAEDSGRYGCVRFVRYTSGEKWEVKHADPVVLVTDELLNELLDAPTSWVPSKLMRLDAAPMLGVCFRNALLHITPDIGRSYIYRIGEYVWEPNAWEARWVD